MPKGKRLVTEHLENISWEVLEAYPEVIRGMIRRRAGVYALYKNDKLYYIGLATNMMARLKQHLKDRHHGSWNRFSVYLTVQDEHIKELESLLLRIIKPGGNKQGGRFVRSDNLRSSLNRLILNQDADTRAKLLGGHIAKNRLRRKVRNAKARDGLKGIIVKRITLKGWRGGYEYSATARKNGTIRYGEEIFDTPSASARAALGRRANGWSFWHYKDSQGEWVKLTNLKKVR